MVIVLSDNLALLAPDPLFDIDTGNLVDNPMLD